MYQSILSTIKIKLSLTIQIVFYAYMHVASMYAVQIPVEIGKVKQQLFVVEEDGI